MKFSHNISYMKFVSIPYRPNDFIYEIFIYEILCEIFVRVGSHCFLVTTRTWLSRTQARTSVVSNFVTSKEITSNRYFVRYTKKQICNKFAHLQISCKFNN